MEHLTQEMNHLQKLAAKREPALFARIRAAWIGICLLNDNRLASKLENVTHPDTFRQERTTDLLEAVAEMETMCKGDPEILGIMRRIRQFVHDHPEVCGYGSGR